METLTHICLTSLTTPIKKMNMTIKAIELVNLLTRHMVMRKINHREITRYMVMRKLNQRAVSRL